MLFGGAMRDLNMDSIKTPSLYVLFSRIPVVHLSQSQASWLWHEFGAESQAGLKVNCGKVVGASPGLGEVPI